MPSALPPTSMHPPPPGHPPHSAAPQVGESIRGCDVFLIQPTTPPVNDNMMELLIMIDACKRASARSITAVLPYFGYARADRKTQVRWRRPGWGGATTSTRGCGSAASAQARRSLAWRGAAACKGPPSPNRLHPLASCLPHACPSPSCRTAQGREAIAAKLSANIITEAGADRVLAMDLHSGQCVGYFDIPVDHVYGDSGAAAVVGGQQQPAAEAAAAAGQRAVGAATWWACRPRCAFRVPPLPAPAVDSLASPPTSHAHACLPFHPTRCCVQSSWTTCPPSASPLETWWWCRPTSAAWHVPVPLPRS